MVMLIPYSLIFIVLILCAEELELLRSRLKESRTEATSVKGELAELKSFDTTQKVKRQPKIFAIEC